VDDWLEARVDAFGGLPGKLDKITPRQAYTLIASEAFCRGVLVGTARTLGGRA